MLETLKRREGDPGVPMGMAAVAPRIHEAAGPSLVWPGSKIQHPPSWCFFDARSRGQCYAKSAASAPRKIYKF